MVDRKALVAEYKRTPRRAGLFVVRNVPDGRWLVGTSPDLPGMLNRQRFQLEMRSHPDKELQRDWNELGPDAFVIEVLDELEHSDESPADVADELAVLRSVWVEKLVAEGRALYPMSMRGRKPS